MTTNYHVDLSDPRVRALLEQGHASGASANRVVQLAGDEETGLRTTYSLSTGKIEVGVVYGDLFLTIDLYALPGEPMKLHLICPRCCKHLTVPGDRKEITFEATAMNPMRARLLESGRPDLIRLAHLGRLSVEAFECPWELGDDRHVRGAVQSGTSLCRQRLVIDNNRARDA